VIGTPFFCYDYVEGRFFKVRNKETTFYSLHLSVCACVHCCRYIGTSLARLLGSL
jgi:hypothetical protein